MAGADQEVIASTVAIAAWPGLTLDALVGGGYRIGRARRVTGTVSTLDTRDQRLARAGVAVHLDDDRWTIRCGDSGARSFPSRGDDPPPEVLAALTGVARGAHLELAVRLRRAGRVAPVFRERAAADASPEAAGDAAVTPDEVGRVIDEDVSVLDGRRVVSRQRWVVIEGDAEVVDQVRRGVVALGLGDRLAAAVPGPEAIGGPDPAMWPLGERPDAATVVQRSLARSVARLLAHDPIVRLDLHVEGVHQLRVATRRLRSDLRTFDRLLGDLPDGVVDDLRWLARLLGEVRDPDVLRDGLLAAVDRLDPEDRRGTTSLVRRLARQRDVALERLHEAMATERYHRLVASLVDVAERPPLRPAAEAPALDVLRPGAQQAWRRLRRAAERAGRPDASVDDVHAMRIRAKQFRYAVDALAEVEPAAVTHAEHVARLQDVLGAFNDAVVAERWLRGAAAHEHDPRRSFVIGQLVMAERITVERGRRSWPAVWRPVAKRRRRAWLDG